MEIVNMMLEKYGGGQMARIFRNYLVLALLLKEMMLSLFLVPQDMPQPDPLPKDSIHVYGKTKAATSTEKDPRLLQVLNLLTPLTESTQNTPHISFEATNNTLP